MNEVKREVQVRALHRLAQTQAIDAEARTFEAVWSAGGQVRRYDWFNDREWIEELDMSPEAVDMSRLNAGAPLLDSHQRFELRNVIGVVERAWLDGGQGVAKLRFSAREEVAPIAKDVNDKIIRNISIGYNVLELKEVDRDENGVRIMRAVRWQPFEVSLVPVGADPVAQTRGDDNGSPPTICTLTIFQPTAPAVTSQEQRQMSETKQQVPAAGNQAAPEMTADQTERLRTKAIVDLGEAYGKYVEQRDIADAIRTGKSAEEFKDVIMSKMQSRHSDTSALQVGMTAKEVQRYSLARAIVASITGDWSKAGLELEASRAVAKLVGASPEGFFVPFDAFKRDFNVGTSTEAGNLVATDLRTDLWVDALRAKLVVGQLGMRVLAGLTASVDMPRKSVAGTLGMLTEIGSASETNPQTAKVTLSPKRIGAYVEYSKQALIQSAIALEPMLRDDLLSGAAVLLENQIINGAGTGAEIRGIRNTSNIGTVVGGTNGATPVWSHFVDLESACANNNAEPDMLAGYLVNTKTRGKLKQVTKSTYLPWIWEPGSTPVNGYRAAVTNNVPSNLTKGTSTTICSAAIFSSDYSMGVLGLFGAPDVTVDPYTLAATGQVRITLNQFADFGVRQPAAFAKIDDLLSN